MNPRLRLPVAALLGLCTACSQSAPLPTVGPCADYPDGVYDFGEIGIGTCLAGATEVSFTDDENGDPVLLVSNANTYQVFTGGSLLAIPWSGINLGASRNRIDETGAVALDLPDFAGGFAVSGDLGVVTVRLSEDARVRQHWDDVWLVDLTDPLNPSLAPRGTDGAAQVKVQSDPNDVEIDPVSGYAFVSNRTTHSVSVLDLSGEEVGVVKPWPEAVMSAATFIDADRSGSRAELVDMDVLADSLVTDDNWSLDWVAGTWRVWVEAEGGVLRYQDEGDSSWDESPVGLQMTFADSVSSIDRVSDPGYSPLGRMYYAASGDIRSASPIGGAISFWRDDGFPRLSPDSSAWDSGDLGGPAVLLDLDGLYLYYDSVTSDGLTGASSAIGRAYSPEGVAFEREDEPVLTATEDWEAGGVADPMPVLDPETGQTILLYGAFDGTTWSIGRATSFDRLNWDKEPLPVLSVPGVDIAAPVVSASVGLWRMIYSRREAGGTWEVWEAESADGRTWTERGQVAELDESVALLDEPPGAAMSGLTESRFRIYGENSGNLAAPVVPGIAFLAGEYGWVARPVSGFLAGTGDAGAESEGGIRVSSIDPDAGLAWLSLESAGGVRRVGIGTLSDDFELTVEQGAVFEGTGGFDQGGADMPVVVSFNGEYHMYYRARRGRQTSIGHATSPDGRTWTRQGRVLQPGNDWDQLRIEPGSVEILEDGRLRLWFAGTDGEAWRIGSAVSSDGDSFQRESVSSRGYVVSTGVAGDWDDSGVRHPYAMRGEDSEGNTGTHLWYAGFDGETWRGGYAFRADGDVVFERAEDPFTGLARPVVLAGGGQFSAEGALRPVLAETDDGWRGFYAGRTSGVDRVGGLSGGLPDALHRVLKPPTLGDALTFTTERGDPDSLAIPLDVILPPGIQLTGAGLTGLTVDPSRGFLYAVSKLTAYIFVIDIRDDSVGDFRDLNYLDIEAVLPVPSASLDAGFRQVIADPSADRLYALADDPEAVVVIDMSSVEDDAFADLINDTASGFLPTPRGAARDVGERTLTDVGPSAMVLHPDGQRLFVANYNANSVSVYDLELGTWGQQVADVELVGEGPAGLALSPDGNHLVVANLTGEIDNTNLAQSTVAIVDIDRDSSTYLEVLTWLANTD